MSDDQQPTADDRTYTRFFKMLRCWVHDAEEALFIAASHRRQAAEIRSGKPALIENSRDWSIAAGMESRAALHDQRATACDLRAAELQRVGGKA